MERVFHTVWSLAALAALGAALDMLFPEGQARRGMELIIGLVLALGIIALLPTGLP